MDEEMTSGHYPKLPNSTSIRTLRFEVLPNHKGIHGSFLTIDLDDPNHGDYEALSYAWENPSPVTQITFPDLDLRVVVALNLSHALERLHKDGQTKPIWIDAICIDQTNFGERNQQVQMMSRVYSEAAQVKIWLGVMEDQTMEAAFTLLKQCANPLNDDTDGKTTIENMGGILNFKSSEEWRDQMKKLLPRNSEEEGPFAAATMDRAFSKAWFKRLWVVQEVCLGQRHIVIANSTAVIDYDILRRGTFAYSWQNPFHHVEMRRFRRLSEACLLGHQLPLGTFDSFMYFETSEPRDYVYALIGMMDIPAHARKHFVVDYNKPIRDVFADATRGVVEATLSLNILQHSVLKAGNEITWARDWALSTRAFLCASSHAYDFLKESKARLRDHTHPGQLVLQGRRFVKIAARSTFSSYASSVNEDHLRRIIYSYTWVRTQINTVDTEDELMKLNAAFAMVLSGGISFFAEKSAYLDFDMASWILESFYGLLLVWATAFEESSSGQTSSYESSFSIGDETWTYNATTKEDDAKWARALLDNESGVVHLAAKAGFSEDTIWHRSGSEYLGTAGATARASTFFLTEDGMMGTASGDIAVGDQLCALYGGTLPFVVREDDFDGQWRLVGTAFVDLAKFNDQVYWESGKDQWFTLI